MRHKRPNRIVYDEATNPSNGWRAPDADDPAAELRSSAEFEREMLALGGNEDLFAELRGGPDTCPRVHPIPKRRTQGWLPST